MFIIDASLSLDKDVYNQSFLQISVSFILFQTKPNAFWLREGVKCQKHPEGEALNFLAKGPKILYLFLTCFNLFHFILSHFILFHLLSFVLFSFFLFPFSFIFFYFI